MAIAAGDVLNLCCFDESEAALHQTIQSIFQIVELDRVVFEISRRLDCQSSLALGYCLSEKHVDGRFLLGAHDVAANSAKPIPTASKKIRKAFASFLTFAYVI